MVQASESQVRRLNLSRRLRRIIFFEVILIFGSYLFLFLVTNTILLTQNSLTEKIFSRFQTIIDIETLERLLLQQVNLEKSYRQNPNDSDYFALVREHKKFTTLITENQQKLASLDKGDVPSLEKETELANTLAQNHKETTELLAQLLGRGLDNHSANAPPSEASLPAQVPLGEQEKFELEKRLSKMEQQSINNTINWRSLVQNDINRLKGRFFVYGQIRNFVLITQALLVIILVVSIGYAYVLPAFERILTQLVFQNEELRQTDTLKTEFLSIASHQLRTPLTELKWAIASLLRQKHEGEDEGLFKRLQTSTNSMIDIVNNLLNITRLEQGRLEIHPESTDIVPIITSLCEDAKELASSKGITLTLDLPLPQIKLMVDPVFFRQIMQNLLDNAIYYNREGGRVIIKATPQTSRWLVEVADTGHGIAPGDLRNLFTKFYRGETARKIRPTGSGVGLYFIKKIIEKHSGTIWATSQLEKGTVFSVTLPAGV